ncbi:hypothetical protein LTR17_000906 [Elasticomyces elasticus]|nr:hypothetical protein LTR17_000906 [Elasticomyces elasticus]
MSVRKRNEFLEGDSDDDDAGNDYDSEDEEGRGGIGGRVNKKRKVEEDSGEDSDGGSFHSFDEPEDAHPKESVLRVQSAAMPGEQRFELGSDFEDEDPPSTATTAKKRPKSVAAAEKATRKSGVLYISRVPPFMKPQTLRHFLSPHASKGLGRIFLTPEEHHQHSARVKRGGNKKKSFTDGWVEFASKTEAKNAAQLLNGNIMGGKKGGFYRDDMWNVKYLSGFKWKDLTEQIANENAERVARLRDEVRRTRKENKAFVEDVERGKMVEGIVRKRAAKVGRDEAIVVEEKVKGGRKFEQRKAEGGASSGATDQAAMASATNTDMWRPLRSRRNLVILVALVVVGYISFGQLRSSTQIGGRLGYGKVPAVVDAEVEEVKKAQTPTPTPPVERYTFNATTDRDNHSLTQAQCDTAFPLLYHEIDRAKEYWKKQQGEKKISPEQIDLKWSGDGGMMGMIYNQQLYITHSRGLNHFGHWKERSHATLHNIQRAILSSPEPIPDIEFAIKINDVINLTPHNPSITVWAFSRNIHDPIMDRVWIIPDFNFWAYPRVAGAYGDFQRQAIALQGDDFSAKRDKLVWRGTVDFNAELRGQLIAQTEGKSWSDVKKVHEDDAGADARISMPDHCRYKFAVHTEGTTWSGRLKYLMSCHSAIFIHHLSWYTHLYHLLNPEGPEQNYVQVKNDWADLPGKMEELIADPAKAKRIADNAASQFRDQYFTPAAQTCYWRKLFKVWREMSFEPSPWNDTKMADGTVERKVKGMTYEEYV